MTFFIIIITRFFIKKYSFQNYPNLFRTQIRSATAGDYNVLPACTHICVYRKKRERKRERKKRDKEKELYTARSSLENNS